MIAITVTHNNRQEEMKLSIHSILYVKMQRNYAMVHMSDGSIYQTRMKFLEFEKLLGADFIRLNRGCLVAAMAIHRVTEKIELCNGEELDYVLAHRQEILEQIQERQEEFIRSFKEEIPDTIEAYHEHYRVFDGLPIAFTDIEMVFDRECHAIDWIFCYGNQALAELEKLPLEKLLGNSFRTLFPDMEDKWLRNYERAALYGETLKLIDYSPEIGVYLDVICFPTFKGHCGCILMDVSKLRFYRESTDTEKAMAVFIEKLLLGC